MLFRPAGIYVPLITPFDDTGALAADDLRRLAHHVLDSGAAGIVALGTTAESAALTSDERCLVVEICGQVCAEHDSPLIVGAGTNDTYGTQAIIQSLAGTGDIAAVLTVVPYYTRPSEDGVVAHFEHLARHSPLPLITYNVPYRTGQTLGSTAILRIAQHPNIIGVKQSVGSVDTDTAQLIARAPQGFSILAGEDTLVSPLLAMGAHGAILATANVYPGEFVELHRLWRNGNIDDARALGSRLVTPAHALMSTPNPTMIKAALHARGSISSAAVRLPLLPVREPSSAVDEIPNTAIELVG
ncbi:dihydrodipicolinate synthase [Gordonia effusa NBRC 100432]|uniref:4-hydroxy-tetrahydrodipicolinate synthase n=1 Tax=Gordonia effusa NBRC 100432 TaxID=1077974 RepID=H0R509_9ACTN|nr:4-hydroxy-tetrahydrodipicolinate synthase [Gordonia effusa]GAB20160.1 dihydrodipicolinate synthase [Gordonia effusa NBRC 100432]